MRRLCAVIGARIRVPIGYLILLVKWALVAGAIGAVTGVVGAAFHHLLEIVTEVRVEHPILIYFLPIAGLLIVFLYHVSGMRNNRGMATVMESVRGGREIPLLTVPLIFVSTVLTHLFGGSAGRGGAALQLGAGLGSKVGSLLRFSASDIRITLLC